MCTIGKKYGTNQNFADINPDRDFPPFYDENFSHLQTSNMLENTNVEFKRTKVLTRN